MLSSLYSARTRRDADGFTLIELLVVVIIIGLLAAIALPIFIDQTRTSVDASVKSDVRNTVTNVVNAQAQATVFPASAKAAVSDANTNIALKIEATGGAIEVATKSSTTLGNVPSLGTSYSVHGWNPNGKVYLGSAAKPAFTFNSASGLFTQGTGDAPVAAAAADPGATGGSTGGSAVVTATYNFDASLQNWVGSGTAYNISRDTFTYHTSPGALRLEGRPGFADGPLETLTPNRSYTVTGWYYTNNSLASTMYVYNDSGSYLTRTTLAGTQQSWQSYTMTFTAPANGKVKLHFDGSNQFMVIYLDDITIN